MSFSGDYAGMNDKNKDTVYIEGDYLVINVSDGYSIELNRCDTHDKILHWVSHLCEKTWITPDVLRDFIRVATKYHNLSFTTL